MCKNGRMDMCMGMRMNMHVNTCMGMCRTCMAWINLFQAASVIPVFQTILFLTAGCMWTGDVSRAHEEFSAMTAGNADVAGGCLKLFFNSLWLTLFCYLW